MQWDITDTVEFLSTLSLRRATPGLLIPRMGRRYFYPRSPCGERRFYSIHILRRYTISIHALLAESDRIPQDQLPNDGYFYPRSPCGERLAPQVVGVVLVKFLSTLSLRRATNSACCGVRRKYISIHALLAESDCATVFFWNRRCHFYPRSPCGERQYLLQSHTFHHCISIHALLAESDEPPAVCPRHQGTFLSTLSLRRATWGG